MSEPQRGLIRIVSDPQIVTLFAVLGLLVALLYRFGFQLIPFIAAFLLAYFLDAGVQQLTRRGMRRGWAVSLVFGAYLVVYVGLLVGPVQLVARRAVQAAARLPRSTGELIERIQALPDPTFGLLPEPMRQQLLDFLLERTQAWFSAGVAGTLGLLPQVTSWVVFLFLVPLLVFFFLKDKEVLIRGCLRCLPRRRELVTRIWLEMETQLGNYVRGKIWEILIVGVVMGIAFALLGFEYPVVFGLLSGLSVLVPYVGALGLAVPLFVLGYLQWGMGWDLGWLMIAYTVLQFLDGNVLATYIFSEAVKLHPVLILLAVILFGSLWGFWGVLLAIPLATFAKALINALLDFRERAGRGDPAGEADGPEAA